MSKRRRTPARRYRIDVFGPLGALVTRWPWVVIVGWLVLAAALPAAFPSLSELARKDPAALLPADAPSSVSARKMNEAFHESATGNTLVLVLTDRDGLTAEDEDVYRRLVDRLADDLSDVVQVRDFVSTPALRPALSSQDGKAWLLPVELVGELGSPRSYTATTRVTRIAETTVEGSALHVDITGPAATVRDVGAVGALDQRRIEVAMAVLLLVILLVIYRNPVTMLVPLATIGVALATAQGVIAGLGLRGLSITAHTVALVTALVAGAGTDYAVFLISRFHDFRRGRHGPDVAVRQALGGIGKVIAASAATVAITFFAMGFTRLAVVSATGVALAVAVTVCFAAAVTFLPALLVVMGRRGLVAPRRAVTGGLWRRSGARIVRRPGRYLAASLVVLIALAGLASMVRYNYDSRTALPASAPSVHGTDVIDRHFPANSITPEFILISSPRDLRTPRALSDLEQLARRVSQLPDVEAVRGITRPTGKPLEQARLSFQAGAVGDNLHDAASTINDHADDLQQLATAADLIADALATLNTQADETIPAVRDLVEALAYLRGSWQQAGDALETGVDNAADATDAAAAESDDVVMLLTLMRAAGETVEQNLDGTPQDFRWMDSVLDGLNTSTICSEEPSCARVRDWLARLVTARDEGRLDNAADAGRRLRDTPEGQRLESAVDNLRDTLDETGDALETTGLATEEGTDDDLEAIRRSTDLLSVASRQVALGVRMLVDQVTAMGLDLADVSAFLQGIKSEASAPSMSGFYIPAQYLAEKDFQQAAQFYVSPDGHTVRYAVQTGLNPFSTAAMDQVDTILATAHDAQPNTTLADADVSMNRGSVTLRDIRDYYTHDLRFIIVVTIAVVLVILSLLLRAIVAPLYLVASVVLSYLAALGVGVLVFQYLLGQPLYWALPGLAFIILVAVGADYNLLLFARLREESGRGVRTGVLRTVAATGGVITAAGVIFAASMFGMLAASLTTLVQTGFVIGVGLLLDTFVVRTLTVPALAALLGRTSWWPSRPRRGAPMG
ncbi:MAG TPA: RND family transporter [Mycolicibacillus parakoreensis]|uniref:RND family transporter n=1 Tax=Mycolicibacillus parakoreensis TaxID=1069221 RepID=A0ABY3TWA4_9MYCO|nr:RND family transporter [Mycolicibacillus parakoreensis]ULN51169.1 RND family transporter [Mycolicibacillus parakoreensis]HLR98641.1 RND family transporter [Mycolicibacillus parakoreensis]